MANKRVVITGMGTINPMGNNVSETWQAILAGKSGIGKIEHFNTEGYKVDIAGEIKGFEPKAAYPAEFARDIKRLDLFVHYAQAATTEALAQSGLDISAQPDRTGICIGSGLGGITAAATHAVTHEVKGPRRVSPFMIPSVIGNIAPGFLSIVHGIKGPNLATQTACATANHAFGVGMMMIQNGMADAIVAGGAESAIEPVTLSGFANMQALSTKFADEPERASRPYDKDRDGFVMSEGAGILILEEYEHAKKRGAEILAEIHSVGMSGDGLDMVQPDPTGEGALRSMRMAVQMAGIDPRSIGYVNTHGTSTPLGDKAEAQAVYKLLDGDDSGTLVGSTKSYHGHLLGAAAGLEAILCVQALRNGVVPANKNLDNVDAEVVIRNLPTEHTEAQLKYALSNSFGFGGHNSSLLLGKI